MVVPEHPDLPEVRLNFFHLADTGSEYSCSETVMRHSHYCTDDTRSNPPLSRSEHPSTRFTFEQPFLSSVHGEAVEMRVAYHTNVRYITSPSSHLDSFAASRRGTSHQRGRTRPWHRTLGTCSRWSHDLQSTAMRRQGQRTPRTSRPLQPAQRKGIKMKKVETN